MDPRTGNKPLGCVVLIPLCQLGLHRATSQLWRYLKKQVNVAEEPGKPLTLYSAFVSQAAMFFSDVIKAEPDFSR